MGAFWFGVLVGVVVSVGAILLLSLCATAADTRALYERPEGGEEE